MNRAAAAAALVEASFERTVIDRRSGRIHADRTAASDFCTASRKIRMGDTHFAAVRLIHHRPA